jgi:hypothetical protein
MINAYISQISYAGQPISFVEDVNQYVFDYIYHNYTYVDSVLQADNYAKSISGNTGSSAYKQALWDFSKDFTTELFKNASHALAELIYSAWTEAGSPLMSSSSIADLNPSASFTLQQNSPNPFSKETNIAFSLENSSDVNLEIMNHLGQTVDVVLNQKMNAGEHSLNWKAQNLSQGVYYLIMEVGNEKAVRKMVIQ